MKKTLLYFMGAIFIGIVFGFLIFDKEGGKVTTVFNESETLSFFQIGVFSNYENALSLYNSYEQSILVKEDNLYRIYGAILKDENNINVLKNYFNTQNINYYIKKNSVSNKIFLKELAKYETLMLKTTEENIIKLNHEILKLYESEVLKHAN